jgi:hypothetical protein
MQAMRKLPLTELHPTYFESAFWRIGCIWALLVYVAVFHRVPVLLFIEDVHSYTRDNLAPDAPLSELRLHANTELR